MIGTIEEATRSVATAADDIGDVDDIINIIYLWTEMMLG